MLETEDLAVDRLDFETTHHPMFTDDIIHGRLSPPPFLFTPILRSHTITMISAEPFTGKTLFLLAMLLSLDTGSPLLGFQPSAGHRSLFIGQDSPTWDIHGQLSKLWNGLGLRPDDHHLPSLFLLNKGYSLADPAFLPFLSRIVSLYSISVLFLDTLIDLHPFDENSNSAMSLVMRTLKRARDTLGLTIIFSHHTAKPQYAGTSAGAQAISAPKISRNARSRGASAISGAIDAHFALDRLRGNDNSSPITLSFPKGRGLSSPSPVTFSISSGPVGDSLVLVAEDDFLTSLLLFLSSPRSPADCSLNFHHSPDKIKHALSTLRSQGLATTLERGQWIARSSL